MARRFGGRLRAGGVLAMVAWLGGESSVFVAVVAVASVVPVSL
jgi:hypothetical protein